MKEKFIDFILKLCKWVSFKDVLLIVGVAMAGKGLYMIYQPSAWLILGIFFAYLGLPKKAVK